MSENAKSYRELESEYAELEIAHETACQEKAQAEFDAKLMKYQRDLAFEEKRNLKGRLEVMEEIKQLAQTYEDAYRAFGYLVSNAIEVRKERGIPDAEIIYVIKNAMALYDMIILPLSTISDIEDQNAYSTFGANYNNDQIPF